MNTLTPMQGLDAAIEAAGSATALADQLGMVKSAIGNWRRREGGIPARHVPTVARCTGLPPHVLRPDLFPPSHAAQTADSSQSDATRNPATSKPSEVSA